MRQLKQFLAFALLSGLGWLCDFGTFTLLVKLFNTPAFLANLISSYVGVTFVWFTPLQKVFGQTGATRGYFLFAYWGYQLVSILCYSQFLQLGVTMLSSSGVQPYGIRSEILAKIIITPFNLLTNFVFMKFLTRLMHRKMQAEA